MAAAAKSESAPVSSIVDEETAREVFSKYSAGGSTIEKSDVRALAFSMGDVLSTEEVEKVFAELDADGNGHVEFEEFYAWLSNPDRERSGNVTRMLRAQLMANTATRLLKAIMTNAGGRKVKAEEGKTAIDMHYSVGDVGEDPAFSVGFKAGRAPEDAPIPDGAKLAFGFTLSFQDEASAGTMAGYMEELCTFLNELFEKEDDADAPRLASSALELDGSPCVNLTIKFATGEMAEMSTAMESMLSAEGAGKLIEDGGAFDFAEFIGGIDAKVAMSMTPSDIMSAEGAAFMSDFSLDVQLSGSMERAGLLLLNAMFKNAAEESWRMEDEYKAIAKACKVAASMSELTQTVKFHSFKGLLGAASKDAVEMLGQVPIRSVGLAPIAEIVDDMHKDSDVPESLKKVYQNLREECGGVKRVQVWGGGVYAQVDLKGFTTDFLPSAEEAHAIQEES